MFSEIMGQYIVKYQQGQQEIWAVKKGGEVFALKMQPKSLADLIQQKEELTQHSNLETSGLPFDSLDLLAPISLPTKVICQGLNYASHRAEAALAATSKSNVMFSKDDSSITGASSPIVRPNECECLDYEIELGLIIGKAIDKAVSINEENLHEYVAGLVLANDMSPRDLQYRDDYAQWFKAKSCRTMLPLGPVLYLMDKTDFAHLYDLQLKLWVNEDLRQDASTDQLIFKPAPTLSEISSFMNMGVGDVLLTGTPGGVIVKAPSKFIQGLATWLMSNEKKVAAFRKNSPQYLKDGDIIKAQIRSANGKIDLGVQNNIITSYK